MRYRYRCRYRYRYISTSQGSCWGVVWRCMFATQTKQSRQGVVCQVRSVLLSWPVFRILVRMPQWRGEEYCTEGCRVVWRKANEQDCERNTEKHFSVKTRQISVRFIRSYFSLQLSFILFYSVSRTWAKKDSMDYRHVDISEHRWTILPVCYCCFSSNQLFGIFVLFRWRRLRFTKVLVSLIDILSYLICTWQVRSAFAKILVFLAHYSRQDGPCWPYPEGSKQESGRFIVILLNTRSLDNADLEFWLAWPSWYMIHYIMLYRCANCKCQLFCFYKVK